MPSWRRLRFDFGKFMESELDVFMMIAINALRLFGTVPRGVKTKKKCWGAEEALLWKTSEVLGVVIVLGARLLCFCML